MFNDEFSSPEERKAKAEELLKEIEIDHIIRNGQVYINALDLAIKFSQAASSMTFQSAIAGDTVSGLTAQGLALAGSIIYDIQGEFIRREAAAILDSE